MKFWNSVKNIFVEEIIETNIEDFVIEGTVLKKYTGKDTVVKIPEGITEISGVSGGEHPFSNNENLRKVILPESIKIIGYCAFCDCKTLEEIKIPNSVVEIGALAFERCERLTKVKLPNGVKLIGPYAFSHCTSLKKFDIPYGVREIAMSTFSNCTHLSHVNIPNTVKSIEMYAFLSCYNLTNLFIPDSVVDIALDIFDSSVYRTITCRTGSAAHQYVNYVTQLGLNRNGYLRASTY